MCEVGSEAIANLVKVGLTAPDWAIDSTIGTLTKLMVSLAYDESSSTQHPQQMRQGDIPYIIRDVLLRVLGELTRFGLMSASQPTSSSPYSMFDVVSGLIHTASKLCVALTDTLKKPAAWLHKQLVRYIHVWMCQNRQSYSCNCVGGSSCTSQ